MAVHRASPGACQLSTASLQWFWSTRWYFDPPGPRRDNPSSWAYHGGCSRPGPATHSLAHPKFHSLRRPHHFSCCTQAPHFHHRSLWGGVGWGGTWWSTLAIRAPFWVHPRNTVAEMQIELFRNFSLWPEGLKCSSPCMADFAIKVTTIVDGPKKPSSLADKKQWRWLNPPDSSLHSENLTLPMATPTVWSVSSLQNQFNRFLLSQFCTR